MPWYNPLSWFRCCTQPAGPLSGDETPKLSRRAVDSSDLPMECMFSMRMTSDMREDGARVARAHGYSSLAEFIRHDLNKKIRLHFNHVDSQLDEGRSNAMQKGGGRQ